MVRVRGPLGRVEERRVRGTGGVCRSRGDRGGEPLDIHDTTTQRVMERQGNPGKTSSVASATLRLDRTTEAFRSPIISMTTRGSFND